MKITSSWRVIDCPEFPYKTFIEEETNIKDLYIGFIESDTQKKYYYPNSDQLYICVDNFMSENKPSVFTIYHKDNRIHTIFVRLINEGKFLYFKSIEEYQNFSLLG